MEDCSIDSWSIVGDEENRDGISSSMGFEETEESGKNTGIADHEAFRFWTMHQHKTAKQKDI